MHSRDFDNHRGFESISRAKSQSDQDWGPLLVFSWNFYQPSMKWSFTYYAWLRTSSNGKSGGTGHQFLPIVNELNWEGRKVKEILTPVNHIEILLWRWFLRMVTPVKIVTLTKMKVAHFLCQSQRLKIPQVNMTDLAYPSKQIQRRAIASVPDTGPHWSNMWQCWWSGPCQRFDEPLVCPVLVSCHPGYHRAYSLVRGGS